jgi:hypothetical protein
MRKRVLMVMTRDIPPTISNGRQRTLRFIRDALDASAEVREFKIRSVFENGTVAAKLHAGLRLLHGVMTGKPCALQVSMFDDRHKASQLLNKIEEFGPDVIYFDSIRLVDYVELVRRCLPSSYIICDFDDLMSRRAATLRTSDYQLSAGYLSKSIPNVAIKIISSKLCRNTILRYEERALKRQERLALTCSDAVTLVSSTDAQVLTAAMPEATKRKVHVIAPPIDSVKVISPPRDPIRFVFIGADSQLQNRLTIRYLVATWKRLNIGSQLVIYGHLSGQYEPVQNVLFAGFARKLSDVYTRNSVALCPSFLRGGIKSKVLEAISYGCVPVGNDGAFEGLNFRDDALAMSERQLEEFLADPSTHLDRIVEAAARFASYCERHHSVPVFSRHWCELLRPTLATPQAEHTMKVTGAT